MNAQLDIFAPSPAPPGGPTARELAEAYCQRWHGRPLAEVTRG